MENKINIGEYLDKLNKKYSIGKFTIEEALRNSTTKKWSKNKANEIIGGNINGN